MLRFSEDKEKSHISEVIKRARREVINDVGKEPACLSLRTTL